MLRVVVHLVFGLYVLSILIMPTRIVFAEVTETPSEIPPLILTEIKVRNQSSGYDEFIEIYNPGTEPVNLNDYFLENVGTLEGAKQVGTQLLGANQYLTLTKQTRESGHTGYIQNGVALPFNDLSHIGGTLRLVTKDGEVIDQISWTNSEANASAEGAAEVVVYQCQSTAASCVSQSITRQTDEQGGHIFVNPVWKLMPASPVSSQLIDLPIPVLTDGSEESDENTPPLSLPDLTCEGVVVSELLPNPAGTDSGKEFIELHNNTSDYVPLKNCSLQVGTKKFTFADVEMGPGAYVAFNDLVTGLTLPNSSGGNVWLLTPTEEIDKVTYPGGLADDVAWANIDGVWQTTYAPTPGAANISMPLKPCPEGQIRNQENGRCQSAIVAAVASLTPCKPGQERNPETNRCRNVTTAVSTLVPCKPGQERNPETNRCRNIASSNGLAPCPEGQERNPETNRCRKVQNANGSTLASVTDVKAEPSKSSPKWWLAGAAAMFAVGYAIFEWRQEVLRFFTKLTNKFSTILNR